jgi:phosphoribosyl-ATP pyrophosphohydrolase/phosphoribosyl-AMP cyclohydrolase
LKPGEPLQAAQIDSLDFSKGAGLIPAIVQDVMTGAVLMLAYMNRDALRETFTRGRVVFYSRSKQRLWEKGETSGHTLDLAEIRADCDGDTLLVTARPRGPVCHLGSTTCFGNAPPTQAGRIGFLSSLETIIEQRLTQGSEGSYTARLHAQGIKRIAQKVGEEGVELALAGAAEPDEKVVSEAADLLFHILVLLRSRKIPLEHVVAELERRNSTKNAAPKTSGGPS